MSGAPAIADVIPTADAADALAVTDGSVHVGTFKTRTQAVRSIPQVRR